jgi:tRNA(fMet)-specific endonuclease VapC
MIYLLDTSICVALIRRNAPPVLERLKAERPGTVGVSSLTVAELAYGVARSARPEQNQAALEQFLLPLEILDFDMRAALAYGRIRRALERRGLPIGSMDLLIGAHALSANLTLVTNNTREFARIEGLALEDWLAGE